MDTSVVVPLLILDSLTTKAAAWYDSLHATVIISDLADLEVAAVASRGVRTGRLTALEAEKALIDFDVLRASSERLAHGPDDFVYAARLIRDFSMKLAAADALHLASARNAGAALATFDERLAAAARSCAFDVVDFS